MSREKFFTEAQKAHKKRGRGGSEAEYRDKTILNFYMPLYTSVINSISQYFNYRKLLLTPFRGENTLLDELADVLHKYHIVNGGIGQPSPIYLKRRHLKTFGTNNEDVLVLLMKLNKVLASSLVIIPSICTSTKNNHYSILEIRAYIPRTRCSIETMAGK